MRRFETYLLTALLAAHGAGAAEGPASAAPPAEAKAASGAAPELTPGIPGLKTVDVRDHRHLWREIEELQTWERANRISVAEYRGKVIEKTAQFLGFKGSGGQEFTTAAAGAVAGVRDSFRAGRRPEVDPAEGQAMFDTGLDEAVARLTAHLRKEPRHELFAKDGKKWLLKLAFGPSEAKEAREAKEAKEAREAKKAKKAKEAAKIAGAKPASD